MEQGAATFVGTKEKFESSKSNKVVFRSKNELPLATGKWFSQIK
jgi:hypothetical protein